MNCEYTFCIYCDNDKCILNHISIDSLGMCADSILINLDDKTLNYQKKILLNKFHPTNGKKTVT